jgi:large subunit ribosomal protein L28
LLLSEVPGKLYLRRLERERACAGFGDILTAGLVFWEKDMAQVCDICGKGPQFGNNISHAHNISRRRWNVNLHPVKAKVGSSAKRLRVCSSCLKAGKVQKA